MFISRHWRTPKLLLALFILEFPITVAVLTLFGIADPDTYRTKLWQQGADLGFNSSPSDVRLAYANHRPTHAPLVWSQFTTTFNLIICVVSMFILLTKTVMHVLHVFYPLLSFVVHAALVALYAISVRNQTAPDLSDPQHPAKGAPWYITRSCSLSSSDELRGYCQQAKASFAVTVVMLALFAMHIPLAAWSTIPTTKQRFASDTSVESTGFVKGSPQSDATAEQHWEMQQYPRTPVTAGMKNPMTPRTVAFNILGGGSRDLPLREAQRSHAL